MAQRFCSTEEADPSLLLPGLRRTVHRPAARPIHSPDRSPNRTTRPRPIAAHPQFRRREGLTTDLPDQRHFPSRFDHRPLGRRASGNRQKTTQARSESIQNPQILSATIFKNLRF